MWSIGNEIPEQNKPDGGSSPRRLTGIAHEEDPTRPTTSAFNSSVGRHQERPGRPGGHSRLQLPARCSTSRFRRTIPKWVIFGSETESCVSSRGVYHLPVIGNTQIALLATGLQLRHRRAGMGLLPGCGIRRAGPTAECAGRVRLDGLRLSRRAYSLRPRRSWPSRSSYFGIVDLAGFPRTATTCTRPSGPRTPMVHVLPHWNWAGHEGQTIPMMAYTNADGGRAVSQRQVARPQRSWASIRW